MALASNSADLYAWFLLPFAIEPCCLLRCHTGFHDLEASRSLWKNQVVGVMTVIVPKMIYLQTLWTLKAPETPLHLLTPFCHRIWEKLVLRTIADALPPFRVVYTRIEDMSFSRTCLTRVLLESRRCKDEDCHSGQSFEGNPNIFSHGPTWAILLLVL